MKLTFQDVYQNIFDIQVAEIAIKNGYHGLFVLD